MELDKRIKSIDSIRSFNTNNDDCLAEEGYFCNYLTSLDNLECCAKGMCIFDDGSRYPFIMKGTRNKYQFFIRKCDLQKEEKQYRPYTLAEFLLIYKLGDIVTFKCKYNDYKHVGIVTGYETDKEGEKAIIHIGSYTYPLSVLFTDCERINSDGEWVPFGVEVEE